MCHFVWISSGNIPGCESGLRDSVTINLAALALVFLELHISRDHLNQRMFVVFGPRLFSLLVSDRSDESEVRWLRLFLQQWADEFFGPGKSALRQGVRGLKVGRPNQVLGIDVIGCMEYRRSAV